MVDETSPMVKACRILMQWRRTRTTFAMPEDIRKELRRLHKLQLKETKETVDRLFGKKVAR